MSVRTRAQTTTGPDEAEELMWMAAARIAAQQAAGRVAPYAAAAAGNARRGVYTARIWTAPRLEQSGLALQEQLAPKMAVILQEQVAPKVAAMLSSAARRVDPVPPVPSRRRRWPLVTIGFITAAGLGIAAYLGSRRKAELAESPDAADSAPAPSEPTTDAAGSDVNGRVQTP